MRRRRRRGAENTTGGLANNSLPSGSEEGEAEVWGLTSAAGWGAGGRPPGSRPPLMTLAGLYSSSALSFPWEGAPSTPPRGLCPGKYPGLSATISVAATGPRGQAQNSTRDLHVLLRPALWSSAREAPGSVVGLECGARKRASAGGACAEGGLLVARAEREPRWPGRACGGASPGGGQECAEAGEASEARTERGLLWRLRERDALGDNAPPRAQHMQVLGTEPRQQVLRAKTCVERTRGDGGRGFGGTGEWRGG